MYEEQISENQQFLYVLLGSALCTFVGTLFYVFMFVVPVGGHVLSHLSIWAGSLLLMVPATFLAKLLKTDFAAIEKIEFRDGPYVSAVTTTGLVWVGLVLLSSVILGISTL